MRDQRLGREGPSCVIVSLELHHRTNGLILPQSWPQRAEETEDRTCDLEHLLEGV